MPSNAIAAYGTLFKRGSSPSGTNTYGSYVTIGDVKNVSIDGREVSILDVTTHSSAASGNYREKVPSLIDSGTLKVDLNWVPSDTTQTNLESDFTGRTKRDFLIQTPANAAGASANFLMTGYVTGYPLDFPTDEVMSGSLTITLTGGITINR